MYYRHQWEQEGERSRLRRLRNPVQAWKDIVGCHKSHPRMSIDRCRVQRNADEEANLEDEGAINEARIDWELESNQVANTARRIEWDKSAQVHPKSYSLSWLSFSLHVQQACDLCRETDMKCERKARGQTPCDFCAAKSLQCEFVLANINRALSQAGRNHALQDYQMQLMLLEQQKKKRALMAQTPQNPCYAGLSSSFAGPPLSTPHPLDDYNMQLMLLEQQNKKRLLMAHQEQDTAPLPQAQPQPSMARQVYHNTILTQ